MSSNIHYQNCPLCGSGNIRHYLHAKDNTVTQQQFPIWQCLDCTGMFTQDVPDEQSIGRYYRSDAYISHTNTKEGLINSLYHRVRNITLEQKRKTIFSVTGQRNGSLLDIGAGVGAFAHHMQESGWNVTALEPDATARNNAKLDFGITLQDPSKLFQLPPASFDAITMWHVLEHVHRLHEYIEQCKLLLKPNGALIIAVPNFTSKDAQHYQQYWAAYDVPRHLYHFSPDSMKKLMLKHGMRVEKMNPMWYDSFYVSLLSEKYRTGKQNLVNGFRNGLSSNLTAFTKRTMASSLVYIIRKG